MIIYMMSLKLSPQFKYLINISFTRILLISSVGLACEKKKAKTKPSPPPPQKNCGLLLKYRLSQARSQTLSPLLLLSLMIERPGLRLVM